VSTIEQFGEQFSRFTEGHGDGFYGSGEHLADTFGALMPDLRGARVADIGSGPGRVVNMLLDMGAAHVTAVEPSSAFAHLVENTVARRDRITYVNATGEMLPAADYDYVFSVGVLHHVKEPAPIVARAFEALKPGGRLLVWLYAREGNEMYVTVVQPLRVVTTRLPDGALAILAWTLNAVLSPYVWACRWLPLPRHRHFRQVFGRMTARQRTLVVFDQLNPTQATYYTREAAERLLTTAGFVDVKLHHRHGYSWAVCGTKPAGDQRRARS
jgi:2-polyprenyl-3-methyl-5-hydroxy-6-metoxy-1,4-benzoquinol methylase